MPLEEIHRVISEYQNQKLSLEAKVNTLTEKLLHSFEELNIFYDVTESLSNCYDIKEICDIALAQITEIMHLEKASISLVDEQHQHLTLVSCYGFIDDAVGQKISIKGTLYPQVIKSRKPLLADDLDQQLIETHTNSRYKYKTKSFVLHPLCTLPMSVSNDVIGVISLADKVDRRPFTAQDIKFLSAIATQIAMSIQNARLVARLKESFLITVRSLSAAIDAKDPYTHGHSQRVSEYALGIGRTLRISPVKLEQLELACLLHDVGKIGIPESILNKKGRLSDEEMAVIQKHPMKGVEILKNTRQTESIIAAVRYHHERYDGHGYPDRLAGKRIPRLARIIAVADTYDAMTSNRSYRPGCPPQIAIDEIRRGAGSQFDPQMARAFIKWIKNQEKGLSTPTLMPALLLNKTHELVISAR